MLKEAEGSEKVGIYSCTEMDLEQRMNGFSAGGYITTKLLK